MKRTLNTAINRSKSERGYEFHSNGPKWVIAHSLGNMLVSEAIQDYGMQHEKYFMLNAAVAMEAFYTKLLAALRIAHRALAAQIEPKVYEYGFLKR